MQSEPPRGDELALTDMLAILRRGFWLMVVVATVAASLTLLATRLMEPVYEARATLVVSTPEASQSSFGTSLVTAPSLGTGTYRTAVASRDILADALEIVDGAPPSAARVELLSEAVSVTTEGADRSSVLRVYVRGSSPTRARDVANAVSESAIRWDRRRASDSLETIIATLEARIRAVDAELEAARSSPEAVQRDPIDGASGLDRARADLALQLSSARALRTAAIGNLELLESAIAPTEPVQPRPVLAAALAALIGVFGTYVVLFVREALSTRVRDVEELRTLVDLPILTEYPRVSTGRRGLPREPTSYLRTSIDFATSHVHPKILLVTSTQSGHGKSSVAIALAESYARKHQRALLIDADLRRPVIGAEYGLDPANTTSCETALDAPLEATPSTVDIDDGVELDVLPGFVAATDAEGSLGDGIRALLDRLAATYDVIVIDSAPILPVADALSITPFSTGVLFAVDATEAHRKEIVRATDLLRRINARLLGIVVTNVRGSDVKPGIGYGYGNVRTAPHAAPSPVTATGRGR